MIRVSRVPDKNWKQLSDNDLGGKRKNTVCLVRYGGFGDLIQITSLFPLIKAQGKKLCVNVTENGVDLLHSDPYIDELLIQNTDQVPNAELGPYWKRLGELFDEFYNLGGVIEQNLLCLPNQDIYKWPHEKRHKKLNKNYSEAIHDVANVEHKFKFKFHSTSSERKWIKKQRKKMRLDGSYTILITLSGSSVHKAYPFMDNVIARMLLTNPQVKFVMVGDEACKLLESGWENEKRVFLRSGKWSIRETLAFAQECDMVVGPETGVLNAVSTEDLAKVVLLSHSSKENLTKHWINTTAIEPVDVDCYPCHQMHYGFKHCNRDLRTGGAMCAANITPDDVVNAIEGHIKLKYEFPRISANG